MRDVITYTHHAHTETVTAVMLIISSEVRAEIQIKSVPSKLCIKKCLKRNWDYCIFKNETVNWGDYRLINSSKFFVNSRFRS